MKIKTTLLDTASHSPQSLPKGTLRHGKTILLLVTVFNVFCYMKCMKGPDTKHCSLNTGIHTAPTEGTIEYSIKSSNKAFINTLTYHGLHGPIKVDTPKLPFTVSITISQGATMSLAAEGTAIEGNLIAGFVFTGIDAAVISHADTCSN